jgi:hypothetical protein
MLRRDALLPIILVFSGVFLASSVRGGTVTYSIVNYPAQQNGWTLSGMITIKTNAVSGTRAQNDVQSWSVKITKDNVTATYGNNEAGAGVSIMGTVSYTSKAILVPQGTPDDPNIFSLLGDGFGSNSIQWRNDKGFDGKGDYRSSYVDRSNTRRSAWLESTNTLGGKNTWVIATAVPEPPAIVLAGVGIACVVLCAKLKSARTREMLQA